LARIKKVLQHTKVHAYLGYRYVFYKSSIKNVKNLDLVRDIFDELSGE